MLPLMGNGKTGTDSLIFKPYSVTRLRRIPFGFAARRPRNKSALFTACAQLTASLHVHLIYRNVKSQDVKHFALTY